VGSPYRSEWGSTRCVVFKGIGKARGNEREEPGCLLEKGDQREESGEGGERAQRARQSLKGDPKISKRQVYGGKPFLRLRHAARSRRTLEGQAIAMWGDDDVIGRREYDANDLPKDERDRIASKTRKEEKERWSRLSKDYWKSRMHLGSRCELPGGELGGKKEGGDGRLAREPKDEKGKESNSRETP